MAQSQGLCRKPAYSIFPATSLAHNITVWVPEPLPETSLSNTALKCMRVRLAEIPTCAPHDKIGKPESE